MRVINKLNIMGEAMWLLLLALKPALLYVRECCAQHNSTRCVSVCINE